MQRDLRSLKNNPRNVEQIAKEIDPNTMQNAQDMVAQYQNKSEAELMEELARVTSRESSAGNLDSGRVESVLNTMAPFLSAEQQQRARAIMSQMLKK